MKQPPSQRVAIVVPLSTHANLTDDELVSMRHLIHYLGAYDKYIIAPKGLTPNYPGFKVKHFARKYFGSAAAHGKMLGHPVFYRQFLDYEYVFFYHLDSLAFSDDLASWCATDVDYIGPPWVYSHDTAWVNRPRVGNGGFTLLRVESALKVLANRYRMEPIAFWLDGFTHYAPARLVRWLERIETRFPDFKPIKRLLKEWREVENPGPNGRNNDLFWSDKAVRYLPEFKVASLEQGLRFAFEASPRTCLAMAGGKMPFGCHAWGRYDRDFWLPHMLKEQP